MSERKSSLDERIEAAQKRKKEARERERKVQSQINALKRRKAKEDRKRRDQQLIHLGIVVEEVLGRETHEADVVRFREILNYLEKKAGYITGNMNPAKSAAEGDEEAASSGECETCKQRKYQDGSDEMVSFKTAQHISPESAAARVRAHEQEHVSNAYAKAAIGNGKVISASVSIHTAICPECGRPYVSGGTTRTQIKYSDEKNPYQKDLKSKDHAKYAGINASYKV